MTDDIAIRVENLGKMYRIYDKPADRLKQLLWGRYMEKGYGREFWATRNVNFTVRRGETVGIVGRNGSGKSTLLQMIAGTLAPSSGSIFVNGRVAALLELGSGFSPDLTGRENAIMQARILGLSETEIAERLPEIIQFADIGDFIDQPTRTYSSGMTMRVAFAAAINASAQVLIVDEALTVGDEGFVRKCFERVRDFQRNGGTLLFVSHAAGLVADICDRAILMHNGSIIKNSTPRPTLNAYHSLMAAKPDEATKMAEDIHAGKLTGKGEMSERAIHARFDNTLVSETQATYGDGNAEISSIKISGKDGIPVNVLIHGDEYKYTYSVKFSASFRSVRFGMLIKTKTGIELSGATTAVEEESSLQVHQNDEYEISFDWKCSLLPGVYFANAGVSAILDGERRHLCRHLDVIMFRVESDSIIRGTGLVDIHRCSNVTKVI